ncbi:unnamed protein product [Cuscuta campestris]|uniref:MADS-box domain-containing protein n=1 Tax=Cuscuta campestris TaxID=132261 RepID=A0A484N5I4_9ASTE|nr:unnamed protein product [Cuscuta campestris]
MVRKCKGRQKIEMTRMSKESNLLVTFSKRRSGLFKKASELSTLCGVDIAIIVFSPGKKVFSFGHPSVDSVVDRFLARNPPPPQPTPPHQAAAAGVAAASSTAATSQLIEAHRNASVRELNMHLMEISSQLELERKRGEGLTRMRRDSQEKCWWEGPVEELRWPELEQLRAAMEELKGGIGRQIEKLVLEAASNPNNLLLYGAPKGLGLSITPHINDGFSNNNNINNAFGYGHGFF